MGHGPSIASMIKKEKAFASWLTERQSALDAREATLQKVQETNIASFYSENSWNDAKVIGSGSNTDFQHQSDFTMKNLKNIIDAVGSAMFSNSAAPKGAKTDTGEAQKAVQAAKSLGGATVDDANVELYIASKVFDVLSGVIMSFGTSTKLSYTHTYKSVSLGYGMQLFCTVTADSQESHGFFTDNTIFEYLYIYEVRFSEEQAKSEGKSNLVQQYTNAISAFEKRLNALDDDVAAGKLSAEQYTDQSKLWSILVEKNEKELQTMKAQQYQNDLSMH